MKQNFLAFCFDNFIVGSRCELVDDKIQDAKYQSCR